MILQQFPSSEGTANKLDQRTGFSVGRFNFLSSLPSPSCMAGHCHCGFRIRAEPSAHEKRFWIASALAGADYGAWLSMAYIIVATI